MATETRRAAVRVIKRQQRELKAQSPPDSSSAAKEGCTNRDLAATVNSWIRELRRRRSETTALFNRLFKEGPPPLPGAAVDAAQSGR